MSNNKKNNRLKAEFHLIEAVLMQFGSTKKSIAQKLGKSHQYISLLLNGDTRKFKETPRSKYAQGKGEISYKFWYIIITKFCFNRYYYKDLNINPDYGPIEIKLISDSKELEVNNSLLFIFGRKPENILHTKEGNVICLNCDKHKFINKDVFNYFKSVNIKFIISYSTKTKEIKGEGPLPNIYKLNDYQEKGEINLEINRNPIGNIIND